MKTGAAIRVRVLPVLGPVPTVTSTWEPTRNLLALKENKIGTPHPSTYACIVNAIGQRTGLVTSGTAFATPPTWQWGYDSLGQVIIADSNVPTSDRAFAYDAIGNRKKSANSLTLPDTDNYTRNSLNQYTAVDAVVPGYDDDGNATAYPLPVAPPSNSTLVWEAENQLVSSTVGSTITTYLYDAQFRRISKITGASSVRYVYGGWNCIAEYSGASLTKANLWGLDLSGTIQGAGGVGGLLAVHSGGVSHFPTYDGNGNVSEYLTSSDTVAAHFEYDPFGNGLVDTDAMGQFAYRFSTKPLDAVTGLYYYGYRYYDPVTGRWPSRDPIEEDGGVNLYAFVANNGVSRWDVFGLRPKDERIGNCVIKVFGGHGQFNHDDKTTKITDPDILENVEVPVNIDCDDCGAAAVLSCSAGRFCNVKNLVPGTRLDNGNIPLTSIYTGRTEDTFFYRFEEYIEAAKKHAKTICNKSPACCTKVKIEAWLLGKEKGKICRNVVGENGYKGWVYDCASDTITEGDN